MRRGSWAMSCSVETDPAPRTSTVPSPSCRSLCTIRGMKPDIAGVHARGDLQGVRAGRHGDVERCREMVGHRAPWYTGESGEHRGSVRPAGHGVDTEDERIGAGAPVMASGCDRAHHVMQPPPASAAVVSRPGRGRGTRHRAARHPRH